MNYDFLREEYPEIISMEQLYRICHISKRKALWLLENGVIPCEDSGKQTRRFRIKLTDVIAFLRERDAGELDAVIPRGVFSSCGPTNRNLPAPMDAGEVSDLLRLKWEDAPDALTTKEVAGMLDCSPATVTQWAARGVLPSASCRGRLLIAKEHLIAYVAKHAVRQSPKLREMVMRYQDEAPENIPEMGQKFGW